MIFAAPFVITFGLVLALLVIVSVQAAAPAPRPVRIASRRRGMRR
ncbi:MAG TPA: hypothetical protein VMF86_07465 [Stellaceae bacterium]|nr:hypothetical protein [Stellaceae bacterium]